MDHIGGFSSPVYCREICVIHGLQRILIATLGHQREFLPGANGCRDCLDHIGGSSSSSAYCHKVPAIHSLQRISLASLGNQRKLLPVSNVRLVRADHIGGSSSAVYCREVVVINGPQRIGDLDRSYAVEAPRRVVAVGDRLGIHCPYCRVGELGEPAHIVVARSHGVRFAVYAARLLGYAAHNVVAERLGLGATRPA